MREVLADGEWHPITELIRKAGLKVPPNTAMAYFTRYIAPLRSTTWSDSLTTREKVKWGREGVALRVITDWTYQGYVEADRPARHRGRRVRLVPKDEWVRTRGERGRFAPEAPKGTMT